jgi:hypothetical protein
MYVWKCWRETRGFFVIAVVIAAAMMPVAAVVTKGTGLVQEFGPSAVLSNFALLGAIAALGMGVLGALEKFSDRTAHFLFTKPRSRGYFVWAGWAVGCVELFVIVLVNLLTGWVTLSHYSKNPFHSALFGSITAPQIVENLIFFFYTYSLTYSLTAVLRNGLKGLGASMAIVLGFPLFEIAIRWRWKINLPIPTDRIGTLPMGVSEFVWIIVALCFVLAGQVVVERAEV